MCTARFDLSFIAGTTLIAVGSGWLVLVEDSLWASYWDSTYGCWAITT